MNQDCFFFYTDAHSDIDLLYLSKPAPLTFCDTAKMLLNDVTRLLLSAERDD